MPKDAMLPFHKAANIYPMDDEHIETLAEDIKQHGQQVPIELLGEQILDGRRRYMACRHAGVEPEFRNVNPEDPIAYVRSLNEHRRHLDKSQRSMVAAKAKALYAEQAKERQRAAGGNHKEKAVVEQVPRPNTGKARDQAGKDFGVSGKLVDRATKVINQGTPELIKAVESGKIAVSAAVKVADKPRDVQLKTIETGVGKAAEPQEEKKSKNIKRKRLEEILAKADEVVSLVDKPTIQVSVFNVQKAAKELRLLISKLLEN